ncbi:TPA: prepilin peptidase [Burkholderia cepacia]|uniref:A24 family peptidase n=1 Tax=Burkholderia cepacia TaxID=292 RepID=UPI001CF4380A|nr:prepilin peptidase [Burkholderia cepacia]MCA8361700.1 prepilin peptidase [Burkholderia cepacia]HDR9762878.1 prepilin peptidase [Burkholderia cepacia ATCC 25416]HDV6364594.1 prepilin peptidase [Burkholderia cepacia]
MARLFFIGVFLGWAAFVASSDIRFRRIRNALVVAGLVGALVAAALGRNPFGISLTQSLVGAAVGLLCFIPLFALRAMGAADVKVFAVLGAWCGAPALLWLWIVASLAAALHVLWVMLLSRTSVFALYKRATPTMTLGGRRATPYAAFLVIPAAAWLLHLVYVRGM